MKKAEKFQFVAGNKKKNGHWTEHWFAKLVDQFVYDGSPCHSSGI